MNMKKLLTMMVVALMTATTMSAQKGYDDTKHEVAISIGGLSNSQWIDILEDVTTVIVGATYKDETFIGPLSAEYFYHAKNWLGVGGVFVFGQSKEDMYLAGSKAGKCNNTYLTLMPSVKFDWMRTKHFGAYTKLAAGATLRSESIDYDDASKSGYSNSALHFNWQASLLGLEAGSATIRGFAELGFGEQGVGLIGLRYKF